MNAKRVHALAWAGAIALSSAAAWSAGAAQPVAEKGWRDVLDIPAQLSPLASHALLNGLARAGERTVAVGQRGHIVYSDDAGKTWQQAQVPVSSDLVAVCFPTATDGWAVGHDGVVLRTRDGGQSWSTQLDGRRLGKAMVEYYTRAAASSDDRDRANRLVDEARRFEAQGAENPFLDVWFRDASNGYVVGAFGLVLRTGDGGASWEPLLHAADNPKALHLYAVRGVGADVYIAGEQGLVLKLAAGDERFRALALPYKGTLFGVAGGANGQAVVVHGLRGTVLRSTDAGRNWQAVPTGVQVGLTASTRDDSGRLIIVSQAGHVLASKDDGASFKPVPVAGAASAAAVALAARTTLVVAGPRGVQTLPLQLP